MTMRKMISMFAIGLFITLFSVQAASAWTQQQSRSTVQTPLDQIGKKVLIGINAPITEAKKQRHLVFYRSYDKSSKLIGHNKPSNISLQPQGGYGDIESESTCLRDGGCTCKGITTHRTRCGGDGDCPTHTGLQCIWT